MQTNTFNSKEKRMPEKMTETEFQELICDLWTKYGETWEKEYQKQHQMDPTRFKTFSWGARLMLKHLGIEIER